MGGGGLLYMLACVIITLCSIIMYWTLNKKFKFKFNNNVHLNAFVFFFFHHDIISTLRFITFLGLIRYQDKKKMHPVSRSCHFMFFLHIQQQFRNKNVKHSFLYDNE
jgi:hypothetical protein